MVLADVLLGYVISRVLDRSSPTARPPLVVAPTAPAPPPYVPPAPEPYVPPPQTPMYAPTVAPPVYTPPTYIPAVTPAPPVLTPPTPAAPTFPTTQVMPTPVATTTPATGMKKAVEVWVVRPELQTVIVGMRLGADATTLAALEASFPQGWRAATTVTSAEILTAKSLLAKWKDGGVIFMGPSTAAGRRAYRMTKHPSSEAQPTATPVTVPTVVPAAPPAAFPEYRPPVSAPPTGIVPAVYTPPVATPAPTAIPAAAPAAVPAAAPAAPAAVTPQVTIVRRGEGLANIAKRLGMPATETSAAVIQKANVPQGPDSTWKAISMAKGGIQKAGRNAGLQPGDRLFVPTTWGPYDASQL